MEIEPQPEWFEAQKLEFEVDLVEAAKRQLQFLAAVDRNRHLYDGPALLRAIYRYNACWLPLLAKHSESPLCKEKLVVPLDCEWIWHCHRLNPVRYKLDSEKLYGRILDNNHVVSSVQEDSKSLTEELWRTMYPEEPYELDLDRAFSEDISLKSSQGEKFTEYDLVSAVNRQSPFFYQVSRSHMRNDLFVQEAVARYKGFLYIIKRNKERSIRHFCVPTYDIDLIWHTHQLHPVAYCKDLNGILGKVLEHDDTDSDRTKGKKLDTGFSGTTQQWEEAFGTRYWKAGAMYRGVTPSSVTDSPYSFNVVEKKPNALDECQSLIQLPELKIVEVLLEFVAVKNLPEGHKGSLFVSFSKKQPDMLFNTKRKLLISSMSGERMVASFKCEPSGELLLELISPSNMPIAKASKAMGSAALSLEELLSEPISRLSVQRWVKLVTDSESMSTKPILLHVAVSFTIPTLAPRVLEMVRSQPFCHSSCFFPLPGRIQRVKGWTQVIDEAGNDVINLQMRDLSKGRAKGEFVSEKEVVSMTDSGESHCFAEFDGCSWSIKGGCGSFMLQRKCRTSGALFTLMGERMVELFPGRRLDYEPRYNAKRRNEQDFITAVEFTTEEPYGRAVGLIDLKSGTVEVKDEWFVLSGIILAFILSEILKKEGYNGLMAKANLKQMDDPSKNEEEKTTVTDITVTVGREVEPDAELAVGDVMVLEGSSQRTGCGGRCGDGCKNPLLIDRGYAGFGSGCKNMTNSSGCGGCGSGCGSGCGNMTKGSGCGSGCGGGCGGGCDNQFGGNVKNDIVRNANGVVAEA